MHILYHTQPLQHLPYYLSHHLLTPSSIPFSDIQYPDSIPSCQELQKSIFLSHQSNQPKDSLFIPVFLGIQCSLSALWSQSDPPSLLWLNPGWFLSDFPSTAFPSCIVPITYWSCNFILLNLSWTLIHLLSLFGTIYCPPFSFVTHCLLIPLLYTPNYILGFL